MHETSSRPFARREHKVLRRKTVSVEGKALQVQGCKVSGSGSVSQLSHYQVSGLQSFKGSGAKTKRSHATWGTATLKFETFKNCEARFFFDASKSG
jgi:hypothetical protein